MNITKIVQNATLTNNHAFQEISNFQLTSLITQKCYRQEGDISFEYNPFLNLQDDENKLIDFDTNEIEVDLANPLTLDVQPSYDGTVNLIINDDKHPPRLINSRFTTLEDKTYKIIDRRGDKDTNIYKIGDVDRSTRLFRNVEKFPKFKFHGLRDGGKVKAGNYVFYIKYTDIDDNETDIISESGIMSVYKGALNIPKAIYGGIAEEVTNKIISFSITDIDTSFDYINLYYSKASSDTQGFGYDKFYKIKTKYIINGSSVTISITGFEEAIEISYDDLNIQYNIVDKVKTQTQVQNMLFFGNVNKPTIPYNELEDLSLRITPQIGFDEPIDDLNHNYNGSKIGYYSANNVYYKVGYWEDIYKLGIVYIMPDDSLSPVFPLRGLDNLNENSNNYTNYDLWKIKNNIVELIDGQPIRDYINIKEDGFISLSNLENTRGVINIKPNNSNIKKPIYLNLQIPDIRKSVVNEKGETIILDSVKDLLKKLTKGFFFVRQKRIPTILGQGFSLGVDRESHLPTLKYKDDYILESFIDNNRSLTHDFNSKLLKKQNIATTSALICPDINLNEYNKSFLNGDNFKVTEAYTSNGLKQDYRTIRHFYLDNYSPVKKGYIESKLTYVTSGTPLLYDGNYYYSSKAGIPEESWKVSYFGNKTDDKNTINITRGNFCSYIGANVKLNDNCIYNIYTSGFNESTMKDYFEVRMNDDSIYYSISDRYSYDDIIPNIYRGDCFLNQYTIRLNRNFFDPEVPLNDIIVDSQTWAENYQGKNGKQEDLLKINRADVNSVQLGMWVTFRCKSNYNLAYRCVDENYIDEQALTGTRRAFYPLQSFDASSSQKIAESELYNAGYASTTSDKAYIELQRVPYIKNIFDTRVMFSNIQVSDAFKNSYRVFQGMAYKDITRQYGAITKLIEWYGDILCIFEHGIGIIPVNEKALLSTEQGQSIHLYGAGVLQDKITVISPDYGSTWNESIIRNQSYVYGVDSYAKKIWRFSQDGFEIISDIKVQKFLNDNISLSEDEKKPVIGLRNIKTFYNNYKGDIMFTFYDDTTDLYGLEKENVWHLCFNDRLNKWITKYSWVPSYSENITNSFFTLDRNTTKLMSLVDYSFKYSDSSEGIVLNNVLFNETFEGQLSLTNKYSYMDNPIYTISESLFNQDIKSTFVIENNILKSKLPLTKLFYIIKVQVRSNNLQFNDYLCIIKDITHVTIDEKEEYENLFKNRFFMHGRSNIIDVFNYNDLDTENQILPSKWYNKVEPFEFEFIVNQPIGLHKVFDNLAIISNNIKPEEIEIEIIGDAIQFDKKAIFLKNKDSDFKTLENAFIKWDSANNVYSIVMNQKCHDMKKEGRVKGNIHYKEDMWYVTLDSIKYKNNRKMESTILSTDTKSTKIRDKYAKIRIKYNTTDLVLINVIKTLFTISYA